jgi:hypothetical protein
MLRAFEDVLSFACSERRFQTQKQYGDVCKIRRARCVIAETGGVDAEYVEQARLPIALPEAR